MFHSPANTTEKRKFVNYADDTKYTTYSPDSSATHTHMVAMPSISQFGLHTHMAGAESMPGSRRGSGNHGNLPGINLQGMSIRDGGSAVSAVQAGQSGNLKNGSGGMFGPATAQPTKGFNPGFLLDEELSKELSHDLHKLVNFLSLSSEDNKTMLRSDSYSKLSVLSAALDLTPLSQTPLHIPCLNGHLDPTLKSSEWPQFSGAPRPSNVEVQPCMRNATNPGPIGGSRPSSGMGRNSSSPTGIPESGAILNPSLKSVPTTPMSVCQSAGNLSVKLVGLTGSDVASFAQEQNGLAFNMNCLSGAYDTPVRFNSVGNKENFVGNINSEMASALTFTPYDYESGVRNSVQSGSTDLYQHNGSHYGLTLSNSWFMSQENNKMGGLHGTKHKCRDIDGNFSGTCLEEPLNWISALCKDQYGCRYLQKKLEEDVLENCDVIFYKTVSLFAELMVDPFGNYLCQKIFEYLTDEQRNMICDCIAHDLVRLSLNIHSTWVMQKMIHFLSMQRQVNPSSYDIQICSIIMALSMHIVTLIKDLHGNHVVQKCLTYLTPEDNQIALEL
ncbi:hypothetical protein FS749_001995 [Ceratobasidium sp. UAMH 11750]|nr:hypothetical protein FS749_001995 [Ceratobasidium sp. UAMH 11750]